MSVSIQVTCNGTAIRRHFPNPMPTIDIQDPGPSSLTGQSQSRCHCIRLHCPGVLCHDMFCSLLPRAKLGGISNTTPDPESDTDVRLPGPRHYWSQPAGSPRRPIRCSVPSWPYRRAVTHRAPFESCSLNAGIMIMMLGGLSMYMCMYDVDVGVHSSCS